MVRVLWAVSIVPIEATKLIGLKATPFGGWIDTMRMQIEKDPNIKLGIACHAKVDKIVIGEVKGTSYYIMPEVKKHDVDDEDIEKVIEDFKPDILHMEGTEFPYTLRFLCKFEGKNVVSLQGIINGYKAYQYGELPVDEMMWSKSMTNILIAWSLHMRKRLLFIPRLKGEKRILSLAKNFLGRTTWDRAHAYFLNPNAKYYQCNRILRRSFYNKTWKLDEIDRYSIYIGNSYNPLKGAHYVIEAIALLKEEFPNIKVRIAGEVPYIEKHCKNPAKYIGYPVYLRKLIKRLSLENNVEFTGILSENEIMNYLLKSNVYVLPSSIENSPNTLGEAMLVGVPCVAAYVGGVPDMAIDNEEALLYRSNDPTLLAWKIRQIFQDDELALKLSNNGQRHAIITHDPVTNANMLVEAYHDIMKRGELE